MQIVLSQKEKKIIFYFKKIKIKNSLECKANLPEKYAIKIVCTKTTDSNSFIMTVESTKLTEKKINVKIDY